MYSLYAIVGKIEALSRLNLRYSSARLVHLNAGISMIPLTEALMDAVKTPGASASATGGFEFLSPGLEIWARALSAGTTIAYLEAEYMGGEGSQGAIVWRDGAIVMSPLRDGNAINQALREIGVDAVLGQNEFEAVGLGRHRSPDEWLRESSESRRVLGTEAEPTSEPDPDLSPDQDFVV